MVITSKYSLEPEETNLLSEPQRSETVTSIVVCILESFVEVKFGFGTSSIGFTQQIHDNRIGTFAIERDPIRIRFLNHHGHAFSVGIKRQDMQEEISGTNVTIIHKNSLHMLSQLSQMPIWSFNNHLNARFSLNQSDTVS